ncbi:Protein of unknown function (DUF3616) [Xenococcus sp. PCC 7305]|uniref:DUF3616 domain-containing protein n=1 Tax=Xenococcus sp. PCC 7305 TaxID=102125 RepID=UPI0002ACA6F4|nr:DUF3616 domain-containing protein [Xenococcus sp. PCC 7305]ELS05180.1 Protein of unknown function (DUF3616) [Xenococcus sp. PCC 7305]
MLTKLNKISFEGDVKKDKDISAIVSFGNFLAIGSDESKRKIQILEQKQSDCYEVKDKLEIALPVLSEQEDQEIDIEGMSISNGNTLFIVGSHSLKRLKTDKKTYLSNRERITRVIREDKKNSIFKLTIDPQTGEEKDQSERKIIRIKEIIENDSILGIFSQIPSKENGVDIEGIASDDDNVLYLGFRGPVLRGNYVPVMVIEDFTKVSDYKLLFVDLGGYGIRDLCKVQGGFLIIAGPVGDGVGDYKLYFWNGVDSIPGTDKPQKTERSLLGKITLDDENSKAEGITLLEETDDIYKFIIVYDGVKNGDATVFQVDKSILKPTS